MRAVSLGLALFMPHCGCNYKCPFPAENNLEYMAMCDWASKRYLSILVSAYLRDAHAHVSTVWDQVSEVGKCVSGQRHSKLLKGPSFAKSACCAQTFCSCRSRMFIGMHTIASPGTWPIDWQI